MKPAPFFLTIGYALGGILGLCLGIWLGEEGSGKLVGWLTAWLGGGALSLGVAYGWYRGLWLQSIAAATEIDPQPHIKSEANLEIWDRDLAAEAFATDLASDPAEADFTDDQKTGRASG